MAGIYIHIPFCKQACHYCNFHFSTSIHDQQKMVDAICKELEMRRGYLDNALIESIYIGGGTPSLLTEAQLEQIIDSVAQQFSLDPTAEITLEANPDDLTAIKLNQIRKTPINRLSIGVQSFFDEELKWMNRAHSGEQAVTSIQLAQDLGLTNISIDLIYGSPTLTNEKWKQNLDKAIQLNLNHISSYCLTVEPKTALNHFIQSAKMPALNEEQASEQFNLLVSILEMNQFEQYEISNFAANHQYAVHNTNYWKNKKYLGIGPSAHSFNHLSRSWNIANNQLYMQSIAQHKLNLETEILTIQNRMNEYIMTSLRTIWGLDLSYYASLFGKEQASQLKLDLLKLIDKNQLKQQGNTFQLEPSARIMADGIASSLFR